MRVLFCKFHFSSFICFCKPSHIYSSGSLKLENSPNAASSAFVYVNDAPANEGRAALDAKEEDNAVDRDEEEEEQGRKEDQEQEQTVEYYCKNRLKEVANDSKEMVKKEKNKKKKVHWMDYSGKELTEIREFEASEPEDDNDESNEQTMCICTII